MESKELEILNGRARFTVGGIDFAVEPVYLDEISEFISDNPSIPLKETRDGTPVSSKDRIHLLMMSFRPALGEGETTTKEKSGIFGKAKETASKNPIEKWIEKKFKIDNKPIVFKDLEREYGLSKLDIADMLYFLYEYSGF